jgi:hypothetical protein
MAKLTWTACVGARLYRSGVGVVDDSRVVRMSRFGKGQWFVIRKAQRYHKVKKAISGEGRTMPIKAVCAMLGAANWSGRGQSRR